MAALGTQLDEIANGFLGLPVPGCFFEYISKLVAEHEHEETTIGAKIHKKVHEAVKEKLINTLFEQLKSKHAQLEPNPDPNFEFIDDHTKFFHFLLAKQAEGSKLTNAADICLPMVSSFNIITDFTKSTKFLCFLFFRFLKWKKIYKDTIDITMAKTELLHLENVGA